MDDSNEKRKLILAALAKRREIELGKNRFSSADANRFDLAKGKNLAKGSLDAENLKVKSNMPADITPGKTIIGKTDKINTVADAVPQVSGKEFRQNIDAAQTKRNLAKTFKDAAERGDTAMMSKLKMIGSKLGKGATKGLKMLPLVGGTIGALAGSQDASAAIPILDSAESVGMSPQAESEFIAEIQARNDYEKSQAVKDRLAALAKLAKSQEEE